MKSRLTLDKAAHKTRVNNNSLCSAVALPPILLCKMTIILRLQGLDVKAGTEDIRAFFKCFHIPDGGVYIVGGSLREAFIAFTAEKDAQLAMRYTGTFLKGSKVTLHISNMEELEHKLKTLLKRKKPSPTKPSVKSPPTSPDANQSPLKSQTPKTESLPPTTAQTCDPNTPNTNYPQPDYPETSSLQTSNAIDSNTAFLLGICTVLHGLQSSHQEENNEVVPIFDIPKTENRVVSNEVRTPEQTQNSKPGYVRLFGLPASTTKEDICRFFSGLMVQEAIVNVKLGIGHGCLVKFASVQDARDALLFNQQSLGSICVEVRGATEKMWTSALEECENGLDVEVKLKHGPLQETANHTQSHTSALQLKRQSVNQLPFKAPKKSRLDSDSANTSSTMEYIVMVNNLPKTMTKTEIKELFGCPGMAHKNVLHLLDKERNRTDAAFLIFNRTEDYDYAMNLAGCHVGSSTIEVSSITRMMMRDMMARTHARNHQPVTKKKMKSHPVEIPEGAPDKNLDPAGTAQTCMFVRNMPGNVQKSQIKSFFSNFRLKQDNISLLLDTAGEGIGEAVIQFKSPKLSALAQRLHGRDFLGTKVLLTCITEKQREEILARNV